MISSSILPRRDSRRPRLGFLGVGWIGRHRLERIVESGIAEIVGVHDTVPELAAAIPGEHRVSRDLHELLALGLDGLVIATPSALHATQAIEALRHGVAVFCQKPLGRDASESEAVVAAARRADLLLGVDLSYRHLRGLAEARRLVQSGALGDVFAVDLTFHNAYGPDKPWFYDKRLSGGGCLIDLGIHLVDLALWMLEGSTPVVVDGRCSSGGKRLANGAQSSTAQSSRNLPGDAQSSRNLPGDVEDYAAARVELASGAEIRLACSWRLHAGRDCRIEASFFGTQGAISVTNINGSFYDFEVAHARGTARQMLASPPDAWGGRAAVAWVEQLAHDRRFSPEVGSIVTVARVIDAIYAASATNAAQDLSEDAT
jgi:predicted dehydrogenase